MAIQQIHKANLKLNKMSENLYTIDKTPSTDLEKFQALRIEALLKERERTQLLLSELKTAMENYKNGIEVIDAEIIEPLKKE